jgi:hypothetical protein
MFYAALLHALHLPKQERRSYLKIQHDRQPGPVSKTCSNAQCSATKFCRGDPATNNRFADEKPSQRQMQLTVFVFSAMSIILCDHSQTKRLKMGHVHHCKFWRSQQDMELDAGVHRFRSSKRVKLELSNHSSRRSVSCIENNIHFRKPSYKFSYPCSNCAQMYNDKKWSG